MVLALAIASASCGGGATSPQLTGDGGRPSDVCKIPGLYCDETLLRRCEDEVAHDVENCAAMSGTCSLARCTSRSCADVEGQESGASGCLFYAAGLANIAADAAETESLLITNSGDQTVNVALETLSPNGKPWRQVKAVQVPAFSSRRLRAPFPALATERENQGVAVRINSDRPVTVVQIEGDDYDEGATNSGGTTLLPVNSLGMNHMVMTYPQRAIGAVAAADSRGGAGRIVVIGVRDDTVVKILSAGSGVQRDAIAINEGDVLQLWGNEGEDLSGTAVNATYPIVVLSGNLTTSYGREINAARINSPDMAHEQMLPLAHWSKIQVAAALPPQTLTCDSLLGIPGASLWRVMAAKATQVFFVGPPSAGLPPFAMMEAGEVMELVVPNVSFTVRADPRVMVTQGMDCEPSLSLAVPVDRWLDGLSFAVLPNFAQTVAVVRRRGEMVLLDGLPITTFVPAGKDYDVAQIPVPSCISVTGVCTHRLDGRFGMTMRGMDVVCGYALTMPTWDSCAASIDPACPDVM